MNDFKIKIYKLLNFVYKFFTSFKLATVILVLMTLITLIGTFYQVEHGLYEAKQTIFYSWIIVQKVFGIPILLPGGLLTMAFLFINIFLGAIIKVRKRLKGVGLLITHLGIIFLLFGGFVTWKYSTNGYLALYPGMESNHFKSYENWQIEIFSIDDNKKIGNFWKIPLESLKKSNTKENNKFPFTITFSNYSKNSFPVPITAPISNQSKLPQIDGFKIYRKKLEKEVEANLPSVYASFFDKISGKLLSKAILWAGPYRADPRDTPIPFIFSNNNIKYGAMIVKKSWFLPFKIKLDDFIFSQHPGTKIAKNYESKITRIENNKFDTKVNIKMNKPMRYKGYTFFQASYGPFGSKPGDHMYSQFAVWKNVADQWPLFSLIIIFIGLSIHFVIMLMSFLVKSKNKSNEV